MGLKALVLGRPGATLSVDGLRIRYAALRDQLASAESQREQAETALVELRAAAARAGLAGELKALEQPPAPKAVEREAPTSRVRVLEGFSTEHENFPWYAATGEVVDLPPSLAWRLASGGL